jgi:hypothetical protein
MPGFTIISPKESFIVAPQSIHGEIYLLVVMLDDAQ